MACIASGLKCAPITKVDGVERWNPQKFGNQGQVISTRTTQSANAIEVIVSILSRTNFRNEKESGFDGELLIKQKGPMGTTEKNIRYRVTCPAKSPAKSDEPVPSVRYSVDGSFTDIVDSQETPLAKDLMRVTCEDREA